MGLFAMRFVLRGEKRKAQSAWGKAFGIKLDHFF